MDILNKLFGLFYDNSKTLSHKLSYLIIFLFVIFIIEYHFDFTYNFYLNNKIEQLNGVNDLKNIYSSDSIKMIELNDIEQRILSRTHYSEYLRKISIKDFRIFERTEKPKVINSVNNNAVTIINKPIRSYFWMLFSSSYLLVIVFVSLIFLPITHKKHRKGQDLAGLIAGMIILFILANIITWISYQIPVILKNPIFNYILNSIIHTIILIVIYRKTK
ncbi:hypothetical protein [uncultured Lutibacter sp.]|uniref:hypothetical protein n=1 Tax=uncultured Lutibacter sp. TaxID=437739 RepID=UPI0026390501|nr:hypothetical protein [uncultured Lutibacter sp.]